MCVLLGVPKKTGLYLKSIVLITKIGSTVCVLILSSIIIIVCVYIKRNVGFKKSGFEALYKVQRSEIHTKQPSCVKGCGLQKPG